MAQKEKLAKTSRSVNPLIDFAAGASAGAASVLSGHPFDTIKVRLQVQSHIHPVYKNSFDCFTKVLKQEGVYGLFKGVTPPTIGEGINNLVIFGVYGIMQRLLQKNPDVPLSLSQTFVAGIGIGFAAPIVACPIELIKIRLQNQTEARGKGLYKGPIDCGIKVYKSGGISGLYKGLIITFIRDVPSYALYFWSYEWAKKVITPAGRDPTMLAFIPAGALAGVASWIFIYPADVIKTRLQSAGANYKGIVDCSKNIYKEGWPRFFSGLWPTLVRSIPVNIVLFCVYEMVIKLGNKVWPQ